MTNSCCKRFVISLIFGVSVLFSALVFAASQKKVYSLAMIYGVNNEFRYNIDTGWFVLESAVEANLTGYYQDKIKEKVAAMPVFATIFRTKGEKDGVSSARKQL